MIETRTARFAIHDWLNTRVRSGERFKEFPGLSWGCFIIADHYLPIGERLRKHTVDSTAQHRQTTVGRYRNCDKGHPRFSTLADLSASIRGGAEHVSPFTVTDLQAVRARVCGS